MEINKLILFLQNIEGIGDASIRKLVLNGSMRTINFDSLDAVLLWLKNNKDCFSKKNTIETLTIDKLRMANKKRIEIELALEKYSVKYMSCLDENYPRRFKNNMYTSHNDFPVILYYKGDISLLDSEKNMCNNWNKRTFTKST